MHSQHGRYCMNVSEVRLHIHLAALTAVLSAWACEIFHLWKLREPVSVVTPLKLCCCYLDLAPVWCRSHSPARLPSHKTGRRNFSEVDEGRIYQQESLQGFVLSLGKFMKTKAVILHKIPCYLEFYLSVCSCEHHVENFCLDLELFWYGFDENKAF